MTTGAANSADTYRATKSDGAINWGCFSIKKRRLLGGFPVGCYVVEDFDGDKIGYLKWKYFAMCNHGSKSGGADTRKDVIFQAKKSMDYCSKCAFLFERANMEKCTICDSRKITTSCKICLRETCLTCKDKQLCHINLEGFNISSGHSAETFGHKYVPGMPGYDDPGNWLP